MKLNIALETLDKVQIHFIVAKARTGSTLLLSMLGHHEQILPIHEKPFPYFLYTRYGKINHWTEKIIDRYCTDFYWFSKYDLATQFSSLEVLKNTMMQYKDGLTYQRAIRLTAFCFFPEKDKSKVTHIVFKELIMSNYLLEAAHIFPESKFILLYRNPLDNVSRVVALKKKWGKRSISVALEAFYWKQHYSVFLRKKQTLSANQFFDLRYEDLIENNKELLGELCHFLSLPFDTAMQQYYLNARKITHSNKDKEPDSKHKITPEIGATIQEGLTKQPDKKKINAWKKELSKKEAAAIWKICRATALKIGYEDRKEIQLTHRLFLLAWFRFFLFYQLIVPLWYKSPLWLKIGIKKFKNKLGVR